MLPDFLESELAIVFVGFNPSLKSAELGHYYAGPGNQFWPFLHEAGFTDRRLRPDEDHLILSYGVGLTDFVKRGTRGMSDLRDAEYHEGYRDLLEKLLPIQPRLICFNGKSGYQKVIGARCDYGLHVDTLEGIPIYLAPSTSGALPLPRAVKLSHFREARRLSLMKEQIGKPG